MTDTSLSSKISFLVSSLNRQLEKEIQDRTLTMKLPIEQVRVLEALSGSNPAEGLAMSSIAQLLAIDASTLTKVVDRMISGNLVYRAADPRDRRRVRVLLTQKGSVLFAELRPLLESQERELQNSVQGLLSDTRSTDLVEVLQHLCNRPALPEPEKHIKDA